MRKVQIVYNIGLLILSAIVIITSPPVQQVTMQCAVTNAFTDQEFCTPPGKNYEIECFYKYVTIEAPEFDKKVVLYGTYYNDYDIPYLKTVTCYGYRLDRTSLSLEPWNTQQILVLVYIFLYSMLITCFLFTNCRSPVEGHERPLSYTVTGYGYETI